MILRKSLLKLIRVECFDDEWRRTLSVCAWSGHRRWRIDPKSSVGMFHHVDQQLVVLLLRSVFVFLGKTHFIFTHIQALADSMSFDLERVAMKYNEWVRSKPFDIGVTTRSSIGVTVQHGEVRLQTAIHCLMISCRRRRMRCVWLQGLTAKTPSPMVH